MPFKDAFQSIQLQSFQIPNLSRKPIKHNEVSEKSAFGGNFSEQTIGKLPQMTPSAKMHDYSARK